MLGCLGASPPRGLPPLSCRLRKRTGGVGDTSFSFSWYFRCCSFGAPVVPACGGFRFRRVVLWLCCLLSGMAPRFGFRRVSRFSSYRSWRMFPVLVWAASPTTPRPVTVVRPVGPQKNRRGALVLVPTSLGCCRRGSVEVSVLGGGGLVSGCPSAVFPCLGVSVAPPGGRRCQNDGGIRGRCRRPRQTPITAPFWLSCRAERPSFRLASPRRGTDIGCGLPINVFLPESFSPGIGDALQCNRTRGGCSYQKRQIVSGHQTAVSPVVCNLLLCSDALLRPYLLSYVRPTRSQTQAPGLYEVLALVEVPGPSSVIPSRPGPSTLFQTRPGDQFAADYPQLERPSAGP